MTENESDGGSTVHVFVNIVIIVGGLSVVFVCVSEGGDGDIQASGQNVNVHTKQTVAYPVGNIWSKGSIEKGNPVQEAGDYSSVTGSENV